MTNPIKNFFSSIVNWTSDHTPEIARSTLNTAAPVVQSTAILISRGLLLKQAIDALRGDPVRREMQEEAALLNEMQCEPEKLKNADPKTCKRNQVIGNRLKYRLALNSSTETQR